MQLDQALQSSTSFFHPSLLEAARLSLHYDLIKPIMNEAFPEGAALFSARNVLDLACGSGDWVIQFAKNHQDVSVVGIDLDEINLDVARRTAQAAGKNDNPFPANAEFLRINVLEPLQFPDESFDYVNARSLFSFMPNDAWGRVLGECYRILRPGGLIRLTEAELPHTTSHAYEQFLSLLAHALKIARKSFSPTGRDSSITVVQKDLLKHAGFYPLVQQPSFLNFSFGESGHELAVQNAVGVFYFIQDVLVTMNIASTQELDSLYTRAYAEMRQENFCGGEYFLSSWAEKRE